MNSLRIDTAIKPTSHLRRLLYVSLLSVLILLAWAADLYLWQYVIILLVTASAIVYLALSRPILLHLSQPPLSQQFDKGWLLLMRTGYGDALWQAELIEVYRYQTLIHFKFRIIEPYKKDWSATVFRDQMSIEQWRELNVLATVTHVQT